MKIVHVCLGGGWYSQNAYQDQLLPRYHRRLGTDVTVIASHYGRWNLEKRCYDLDTTPRTVLPDGVKLLRIKPVFPLKINSHIHLYHGLSSILKQEKPDLIFLHGLECLNYLAVIRYKYLNPNVRIVCDNHADDNNSHRHWTTRLWSRIIINRLIVKRLVPITEWFYGVTPIRCDFLIKEYNVPVSKVKLLVLGADDDSMHIESRKDIRQRVRKHFNVAEEDFLIVSGGRINMKKSRYFLSIAQAVNNLQDTNIKLLIFGPVSDDVRRLFCTFDNRRVVLAGEVASNRVYDFFFAADLVVFPGLHSVMWEQAVASKVPCVFHYINGFQHVDIGGNCCWVKEDAVEQYQSVFERLYYDKALYRGLFENANSGKADKFLYSKVAQQVLEDVFPI